jgi:predicted GIY-YIG superfamily endonuclease
MNEQTRKEELTDSQTKHFTLYILRLIENKYYVGLTTRTDPRIRINEHFSGKFNAAKWTKKYKPLETLAIRSLGDITQAAAEQIENAETLEWMKMHGYQNVRGGDHTYSGKYVKIGSRFWPGFVFETIVGLWFVILVIILLMIKTL